MLISILILRNNCEKASKEKIMIIQPQIEKSTWKGTSNANNL